MKTLRIYLILLLFPAFAVGQQNNQNPTADQLEALAKAQMQQAAAKTNTRFVVGWSLILSESKADGFTVKHDVYYEPFVRGGCVSSFAINWIKPRESMYDDQRLHRDPMYLGPHRLKRMFGLYRKPIRAEPIYAVTNDCR